MEQVIVNKDELTARVSENRKIHEQTYKEAYEGYLLILENELAESLQRVKNKEKDAVRLTATKPSQYLDEYDTVLEMLKFSIEPTITLQKHEFERYVLDKWSWKSSFASVSMSNITGSAMYKKGIM